MQICSLVYDVVCEYLAKRLSAQRTQCEALFTTFINGSTVRHMIDKTNCFVRPDPHAPAWESRILFCKVDVHKQIPSMVPAERMPRREGPSRPRHAGSGSQRHESAHSLHGRADSQPCEPVFTRSLELQAAERPSPVALTARCDKARPLAPIKQRGRAAHQPKAHPIPPFAYGSIQRRLLWQQLTENHGGPKLVDFTQGQLALLQAWYSC